MKKTRLQTLVDNKTLLEIEEYQEAVNEKSQSKTIERLIKIGLETENNTYKEINIANKIKTDISEEIKENLAATQKSVKGLEHSIYLIQKNASKSTSSSLGSLVVLSYIYRDLCTYLYKVQQLEDKRFEYWYEQDFEDIFKFFKSIGGAMTAAQKIDFMTCIETTRRKNPYNAATTDELVGIKTENFNPKIISGNNNPTTDKADNTPKPNNTKQPKNSNTQKRKRNQNKRNEG